MQHPLVRAALLVFALWATPALTAQDTPSAFRGPQFLVADGRKRVVADMRRLEPLHRRVTLDQVGQPVAAALDEVARQANLTIVFNDQLLPADARLLTRLEGVTVAAALTELLIDARVDVVFNRDGSAALVRRDAKAPSDGVVVGRVFDPEQNPVAHARIAIGSRSTASDATGYYRFAGVPAGDEVIVVNYLGFRPDTGHVEVRADATVSHDVTLRRTAVQLEGVVVDGLLQGQTRALNSQRVSPNLTSVVSSDAVGELPDKNVAEGLQRVPGVAITRDQGEGQYVSVRGLGPNLTQVTVDGVALSTPEKGVRQVPLSMIPTGIIGSLEVTKTPTPDMEGGGLGGVVTIHTLRALEFDRPVFRATLGESHGSLQDRYSPPNGTVVVGTQFGARRQLGVLVSGSYDRRDFGADHMESQGWQRKTSPTDSSEYWQMVAGQLLTFNNTRTRLAGTADIDYRPTENSRYYVRGMIDRFDEDREQYQLSYNFNKAKLMGLTATTGDFTGANVANNNTYAQQRQLAATLSAGTALSFGRLDWNVDASGSRAGESDPANLKLVFQTPVQQARYDASDAYWPQFTLPSGEDVRSASLYTKVNRVVVNNDTTHDRQAQLRSDLTFHLTSGSDQSIVKAGVLYRDQRRSLNRHNGNYSGTPPGFSMSSVLGTYTRPDFLENRYAIWATADPAHMVDYFGANRSLFAYDSITSNETDVLNTYVAHERVASAYGMASSAPGNVGIQGGVRLERTTYSANGGGIVTTTGGDQVVPVAFRHPYVTALPTINVRYEIQPDLIARVGASRTMARPLFDDLAPQRQISIENLTINEGNPDLDPYLSNNVDLSVEKYLPALGLLYGGAFYKHVDSFVFTRANPVTSGEYAGYTLTRPENGQGAEVFGAELQWQQQLSALPGLLGGLGIGANYTYVDSRTHVTDRPGEVFPLVGQSRHTANFIGSFQRWGATARVAYNYRSRYLNVVQGLADNDEYIDDYGQWDSQFEYALRWRVRLFADVVNLGDAQLRAYSGDRSRVRMVELTGRRVQFGTRVDF